MEDLLNCLWYKRKIKCWFVRCITRGFFHFCHGSTALIRSASHFSHFVELPGWKLGLWYHCTDGIKPHFFCFVFNQYMASATSNCCISLALYQKNLLLWSAFCYCSGTPTQNDTFVIPESIKTSDLLLIYNLF